jgi:hypothetical protein
MRWRALVPSVGKSAVPWLLEGLLIVVSVALGVWVSQLQQARADRDYAARVLSSLQAEIEHNHAALEPYVPFHRTWAGALSSVPLADEAQSGLDIWFATRPSLPATATTPFPHLRRSAWDAALAGDALRLIDHDVSAALSDIYRMQEIAGGNVDRLANGALSATTTFDPASRRPATKLLWLTLVDIQSAEALLLDLYRRHLPLVRSAAAAGR